MSEPTHVNADVLVADATLADAEGILSIAREWQPARRPTAELSRTGFLVSDFDLDKYRQFIRDGGFAYVARAADRTIGFLLGYPGDLAEQFGDVVAARLRPQLKDFVVCKQIAVAPGHVGKGVARGLYRHLMDRLGGRDLIAAVVDDPPNEVSRAVHQALGFQPAFQLPAADGRMRTVWRFSPTRDA